MQINILQNTVSQAYWLAARKLVGSQLSARSVVDLQLVDSHLTARWLASHNMLAHTLVLLVRDCF